MFLWGDVSLFFVVDEEAKVLLQGRINPNLKNCSISAVLHKSLLRLLSWQVRWGEGMKQWRVGKISPSEKNIHLPGLYVEREIRETNSTPILCMSRNCMTQDKTNFQPCTFLRQHSCKQDALLSKERHLWVYQVRCRLYFPCYCIEKKCKASRASI